MFRFFFLATLFFCTNTYTQTKAIAFKSHSGNLIYYTPKGDGNFGLIEPMPWAIIRMDSIARINDSTIVQYNNTADTNFIYDTLINHPFWNNPNLNIDSLKESYNNEVKFIGFETKPEIEQQKQVVKPGRKKKNKKKKRKTAFMVKPKNDPLIGIS